MNWTFMQQGMVDEVSMVLVPVADGRTDSVTVFEQSPFLLESFPVEFHLKHVERLKGDSVWLVYTVL